MLCIYPLKVSSYLACRPGLKIACRAIAHAVPHVLRLTRALSEYIEMGVVINVGPR